MTPERRQYLLDIAISLDACSEGLMAGRKWPAYGIIRIFAKWILSYMGQHLTQEELWQIVRIRPDAAIDRGWHLLSPEMKSEAADLAPVNLLMSPHKDADLLVRCARQYPREALKYAVGRLPAESVQEIIDLACEEAGV
jgi:hypothetical protein